MKDLYGNRATINRIWNKDRANRNGLALGMNVHTHNTAANKYNDWNNKNLHCKWQQLFIFVEDLFILKYKKVRVRCIVRIYLKTVFYYLVNYSLKLNANIYRRFVLNSFKLYRLDLI